MKRFIFKNTFTTKTDKRLVVNYIDLAIAYEETALKLIEDGDVKNAAEMTLAGIRMWKLAAKCAGFRNIKDMDEYIKRHGHI